MPSIELLPELDASGSAPVWVELPTGTKLPEGALQVREEGGRVVAPAQREGDRLVFLLSGLQAGKKRRFRVEGAGAGAGVRLKEDGPAALSIVLPEGPFSTYRYDAQEPRPYLYPVLGPGGKPVTRNYPMRADVPGEDKDHPHHRSFWTAYGEVNGVDDWSQEKNHGWIRHKEFLSRTEGPVFGGFAAASVWTAPEGKPLLNERRTLHLYNAGPDRRLLDYDVDLAADYEDVQYGDTKEGGVLAFRVATTMDGNKGGLMENSNGGKGEKQVWGKRATWLDYSGPVEGEVLGVAMMDHPGNLHHPCYWHARDYGLVGTNPFARAAFNDGAPVTYVQKKGETLRFRYRLLIHRGAARDGGVEDAYHAWVQPPAAKLAG
jgi:hypothetical protein